MSTTPETDSPAADGDGIAQVVEPKWAVRADSIENGKARSDVRMSDADDLVDAIELALADVRGRRPDAVVQRVTAYAPVLGALVPRTAR